MRYLPTDSKPKYTEEQYRIARYESSALDYALANGYKIVDKGKYKSWAEHDSFVFAPNGLWFWNSRGLQGGAIEFLTQIEHKSYVEAVLTLAGDRANESAANFVPMPPKQAHEEKKPFVLPEKAKDFKRLYGYLLKERKLDSALITYLIRERKLYLSEKHYNVVFVSYDQDGTPKAAYQRGTLTLTEKPFKMDVTGSDKSYPFHLPGLDSTSVSVYEGAIDVISHATLLKRSGEAYKDSHRIATGGINNKAALDRFLGWYPNITHLNLCFDNDQPGSDAAIKWSEEYTAKGFIVTISTPQNKDYNDDLKQMINQEEADRSNVQESDMELER